MPEARLFDAGKIAHLAELLPKLRAEGHRVLIFSQWTNVLDVLGLALDALAIRFLRLDGSTDVGERQRLIDEFHHDDTLTCFLLTTRAGGLGINLTCADTVIIHDCDFNPAMDKQAMDRCHRLGQTRPVRVMMLAAKQTVDERIVQIAVAKAGQRELLFGERESKGGTAPDSALPHSGHALMGSILRDLLGPAAQEERAAESSSSVAATSTIAPATVGASQDETLSIAQPVQAGGGAVAAEVKSNEDAGAADDESEPESEPPEEEDGS